MSKSIKVQVKKKKKIVGLRHPASSHWRVALYSDNYAHFIQVTIKTRVFFYITQKTTLVRDVMLVTANLAWSC